jgi:hypothetical protein
MIVRQEIFTRVVNQLKRIKTVNTYTMYGETANYLTNLGLYVFPWRATPFNENQLPGLIVRDLDEPQELSSNHSQRVIRQLHIQVEVVMKGDAPINDLWAAYADIEAAIGEGRESVWADITKETRPRISRSLVEQESSKIAGGLFECYIDYPTLAFKSVA